MARRRPLRLPSGGLGRRRVRTPSRGTCRPSTSSPFSITYQLPPAHPRPPWPRPRRRASRAGAPSEPLLKHLPGGLLLVHRRTPRGRARPSRQLRRLHGELGLDARQPGILRLLRPERAHQLAQLGSEPRSSAGAPPASPPRWALKHHVVGINAKKLAVTTRDVRRRCIAACKRDPQQATRLKYELRPAPDIICRATERGPRHALVGPSSPVTKSSLPRP